MTKEQALNEYMAALKNALEKRWQYTYYYFKESNKELSEELLNDIADTCTQSFFERMQRECGFENEFNDKKLWNKN